MLPRRVSGSLVSIFKRRRGCSAVARGRKIRTVHGESLCALANSDAADTRQHGFIPCMTVRFPEMGIESNSLWELNGVDPDARESRNGPNVTLGMRGKALESGVARFVNSF